MTHIIFGDSSVFTTAILIKENALNEEQLIKHYVDKVSIPRDEIIAYSLKYQANGKAPAGFAREYLKTTLKSLKALGVTTLLVCDTDYFKVLTKVKKVDSSHGYIKPCVLEGFTDMNVIICTNYKALFFNPGLQHYIDLALKTLEAHNNGIHIEIGSDIIHSAEYPSQNRQIREWLEKLHQYPELTCDIETFSLKFYETGIATIAFAWDKHNGIAFACDYHEKNMYVANDSIARYGEAVVNKKVRSLLLNFFKTYKGKLTYHNANFDIKIITHTLFMSNYLDQRGMIEGINTMSRSIDDTQLITYLATNTTAGNRIGLKIQAHEFAGDYAVEDIDDIRQIPLPALLKYNLIDCLSTWYVKEKHYPTMIADSQLSIYDNIFIPSVKTILQMELTGIPLHMPQVYKAQKLLVDICNTASKRIQFSTIIMDHVDNLRKEECLRKNIEWKTKRRDLDYFDYIVFNPASNPQMQELLYERLGLPILDKTKTKQAAVGGKTLKKLIHHTKDQNIINLLENLITLAEASKISETFIEAFIKNSVLKADGIWYLHGNFNLGGTVSGRLSCVAAHTPIVTLDGTKPIIDVKIGDKVWTHKEQWQLVENTIYKGIGHMYNVHLCNGEVLTCTTDHKVLLSDGQWKTLGEILHVSIQNLDKESSQYNPNHSVIQKHLKRAKQFSSLFKSRTPKYPLLAGRGQQRIKIEKIEYSKCSEVYDITVAEDASYLACGFYSHNSSKPNLQNIPSGSKYAPMIKKCFISPPGWLFCGADFDSLEDKISALTTRDPNKLKVYVDGLDGHALRAYSYYKDQMPDIQLAEKDDRVFCVKIGLTPHYIKSGTIVSCPIKGPVPIEEYFDAMESLIK